MGRRKETATVYLEPEQLAQLRAMSARTRVPWSVYVRVAVNEWLVRNEVRAPEASDVSPGEDRGVWGK